MISKYYCNQYCCEDISMIEGYEVAISSPKRYDLHHKLELIATGGVVNATKQDLKDWGLYYNRPADELIFLPHGVHTILHSPRKGTGHGKKPKVYADPKETARKRSLALKGKTGVKGAKSVLAHCILVLENGKKYGSKREAARELGKHVFERHKVHYVRISKEEYYA